MDDDYGCALVHCKAGGLLPAEFTVGITRISATIQPRDGVGLEGLLVYPHQSGVSPR